MDAHPRSCCENRRSSSEASSSGAGSSRSYSSSGFYSNIRSSTPRPDTPRPDTPATHSRSTTPASAQQTPPNKSYLDNLLRGGWITQDDYNEAIKDDNDSYTHKQPKNTSHTAQNTSHTVPNTNITTPRIGPSGRRFLFTPEETYPHIYSRLDDPVRHRTIRHMHMMEHNQRIHEQIRGRTHAGTSAGNARPGQKRTHSVASRLSQRPTQQHQQQNDPQSDSDTVDLASDNDEDNDNDDGNDDDEVAEINQEDGNVVPKGRFHDKNKRKRERTKQKKAAARLRLEQLAQNAPDNNTDNGALPDTDSNMNDNNTGITSFTIHSTIFDRVGHRYDNHTPMQDRLGQERHNMPILTNNTYYTDNDRNEFNDISHDVTNPPDIEEMNPSLHENSNSTFSDQFEPRRADYADIAAIAAADNAAGPSTEERLNRMEAEDYTDLLLQDEDSTLPLNENRNFINVRATWSQTNNTIADERYDTYDNTHNSQNTQNTDTHNITPNTHTQNTVQTQNTPESTHTQPTIQKNNDKENDLQTDTQHSNLEHNNTLQNITTSDNKQTNTHTQAQPEKGEKSKTENRQGTKTAKPKHQNKTQKQPKNKKPTKTKSDKNNTDKYAQNLNENTHSSSEDEDLHLHFNSDLFNQDLHILLKDELPKPKTQKNIQFTLEDKLNKDLKNGDTHCRCGKTIPFYKIGDTINIMLVSNTLGHLSRFDKDHKKIAECSHMEVLQIMDATIPQITNIASPIIKYLRQFFTVEVLACIGGNDLAATSNPIPRIIHTLTEFDKEIASIVDVPPTCLKIRNGNLHSITIKYVTLPYMLAISHLDGDTHKLKNSQNRTDHISSFNDKIREKNKELPERSPPTMHALGITQDPLIEDKPFFNRHHCPSWHWPPFKINPKTNKPNYTEAQDIFLLTNNLRTQTWNWIHAYFESLNILIKSPHLSSQK